MSLIRLLIALLAFAGAGTAQAEWRRAESPNFVVYSTTSEERLRERILLLEDFDRLLRLVVAGDHPPSPNKLHVYVVPRTRDLSRIREVADGIGGFYATSAEGIAAFVSDQGSDRQNGILFHEYAHHFMLQHAQASHPGWYIEGFAEYFMTAKFTRERIDIGNFSPGRVSWLVNAEWMPWERVLGGTAEGLSREGISMYYAQAWLLTHYFYSTSERQAALRRYLAAARGEDPVRAVRTATGMTMEAFTREMRNYIRGGTIRYRQLERPPAQQVDVRITGLAPSADDLLLHEAQLRVGVPTGQEAAALRAIRTAAARHADDPFAQRVLAHAELMHGDRAVALRLLEGLTAANPGDAELMYLRGRLHLQAAEAGEDGHEEQARIWFARAHRASPNHFQTLYRYAQSLRGSEQATAENTTNVLLLAHQLAPQVHEIRFNAAAVLLARGDIGLAEDVLAPLLTDPHNPGGARAAKQMLEQARSRSQHPAEAEADASSE